MSEIVFLQPVMALFIWTSMVWVWVYFAHMVAVQRAATELGRFGNVDHIGVATDIDDMPNTPSGAAPLMGEQPVLFYALMLVIAVTGGMDMFSLTLAWLYVGLRVAHAWVFLMQGYSRLAFGISAMWMLIVLCMIVKEALRVFL